MKIDFTPEANWFTLTFPFEDQDMAAGAADIPGSKFFKPAGYWIAPKSSARAVGAWGKFHHVPMTPAAMEAMDDMEAFEHRVERSSAKVPLYPEESYDVDVKLYDYQQAGVEYILDVGHGRTIVGDEMGTGKTLQAIAAVHTIHGGGRRYPAVVICPASLKINWKREIQQAAPGTTIEILRGENAHPRLWHADWTIVNYDILDSWEAYLPEAPMAVIADESHLIMNPNVTRTKATLKVFDRVPEDGMRLCLSGTAVLNKTSEIMTQLQAIGRLNEVGGTQARKQWKGQGRELNQLMRGNGMYLRRLKADVWKDAPERHWISFPVEGEAAAMVEYRKAEKNISKWLGDRAKQAARDAGASTLEAQSAAWHAVLKARAAEILVMFTHLKQLAAHAKMAAMKDWINNFMAQDGEKLAAFAWHTEVLEEIVRGHPKMKPLTIVGGQTELQRQRSVDLFQKDPSHRLLVGQIKAAGVGITLTAASNVLLVEQGWTPGAHDQVLDRVHRRGQSKQVIGWVPLTSGTIDEDIFKLVQAKRPIVDDALDGWARTGPQTETTVIEELAEKFFRKGIAPKLRE